MGHFPSFSNDSFVKYHGKKNLELHDSVISKFMLKQGVLLLDFSLTVKAAPHERVIRTSQP